MTTTNAPSPSGLQGGFNRQEWASAFCNVAVELSEAPLSAARGSIPEELTGTLYRNGPGRLERDGQWVHHPFDGDGMVAALRFEAGRVLLTNRFVRTEGFEPHALDPETLETKGITLLDGVLRKGDAFSAHPRFDPGHHGAPRMVTFGVKAGPRSTVRLMEFAVEDNPDAGVKAGQLLSERRDSFNGFAFLHDFAITPNWALFLQNAIAFNPLPYVTGQKGAAQCLQSKPGAQAKFWLIPRDSGAFAGQPPRILDAPDGFVFHHLNAWEDQGAVVVESIYYSDFPSIGPDQDFRAIDFELLPEGLLEQCRIDLNSGTVSTTRLSERCCEFAMVNPTREGLPSRYAWMAVAERETGNDPLQAIKKLDLQSGERCVWSAAPRGFVSEPVMVPRLGANAEDDGWVLVLVWNGARCATDLMILNAADMTEQAVLELPLAIPYGLHGSWAPA